MALSDWVNVKAGYARKATYSVTGKVGGQTLLDTINDSGLTKYLELMGEKRVARAATRAINKGLVTLRSISTKQISRILAVQQAKIRATFSIKKARFERLEGSLMAAGEKALPLYAFSPSPKTPEAKRPKVGVSVRIRKDRGRSKVPGSFIARVGAGSIGVFERVRNDRSYPIRKLYGPAPLAYLLHDEPVPGGGMLLVDAIDEEFDGVFEKYLAHELQYEYQHMPPQRDQQQMERLMYQHIFDMTTALATNEAWLAWCLENLGQAPTIAYEPELPTEGIPDSMYPFVFLYSVRVTGPSSFTVELACGILDDEGQQADTVTATVHGASVAVSREYCQGLLNAMAMFSQAVDCIHRMRLGNVEAQGETGSAVLHPFYEAWGTIAAEWKSSTRKPVGR